MSETAIRAEGIGKRFRIGERQSYKTLRDTLVSAAHAPFHAAASRFRNPEEAAGRAEDRFIWALKDVSFEIQQGEAVGIIGGNGAGKSTLLKVLSRITEPTAGMARVRGRVGTLLEVGTGFHPELTGRENVFLNGAIIGMRRAEIRKRFDDIVAFSEMETFIDTPIKHYSSGMYMRLAFAVAAYLEPEILFVDEVLAVGDAAFQKKCLGRMGQAAEGGRTVLFVSHNMAAVRNLCRRSILLYGGQVRMEGATEDVIAEYLSLMGRAADRDEIQTSIAALPTDPVFRLLTVTVSQRGLIGGPLGNEESVTVQVDFEVRQPVTGLRVYFDLCDEFEDIIIRSFHDEDADAKLQMPAGLYRSTAIIPGRLLAPRRYLLVVRAAIHNVRTCTGRGIRLGLNVLNTGRLNRAYPEDVIRSKLQPPISWHTETVERP